MEAALGVRMALHDSSFRGGDCYRLGTHGGEGLILQTNHDPIDGEAFEDAVPTSAFLLCVEYTARAEQMIAALAEHATLVGGERS